MFLASLPVSEFAVTDRNGSRDYTISIDTDLVSVLGAWQELEEVGDLTPFQTQAWLLPWYQLIAPALGISPIFLTVRNKSSGRPMMLLPLAFSRERGVATIGFPDRGVSDYNAPLLAVEFQPSDDEFTTLWTDILRLLPKADRIVLEKMPANLGGRPNPLARLSGSQRMRMSAWECALPASRADYDKTLKASVRKELRRKRRNLELDGTIHFLRAKSESQALEVFQTLRRQRQARCVESGQHNILGEPIFSRFYEAVLSTNWASGFCVVSALTVDDRIVATLFAVRHRGRYNLLIHSFESASEVSKSPGIVAIDSAITDQIDAGAVFFDFTIGNEPYKFQFAPRQVALYSREQAFSPLGRSLLLLRRARRLAGDQLRRLPKNLRPRRLRA